MNSLEAENGRYIIYCPLGVATGGPEALHQLCHYINLLGEQAYLLPIDKSMQAHPQYKHFQAPIISEDQLTKRDILIVPETQVKIPEKILKSVNPKIVLWWLSVDNCNFTKSWKLEQKTFPIGRHLWKYRKDRKSPAQSIYLLLRSLLINTKDNTLISIEIEKCSHLTQSEYARLFLKEQLSQESIMVSDYIYAPVNSHPHSVIGTKNIISYNGNKGNLFVECLFRLLPEFEFIAIKNMNHGQALEILQNSALYLDFGHFPGKDRLPREAILQRTPVLLANRGAARNELDFRIPRDYKIDLDSISPISVAEMIRAMVETRSETLRDQQIFYEDCIKSESKFRNEVKTFLDLQLATKNSLFGV
jgi:hypothetical protein